MRVVRGRVSMMAGQTIPVVILSGFLGAGKSTLINDLLASPAMADTAIVVNEFGDIGIDHELIRVDQREMMVTTLGCLCCTAGSDIRASLFELHEAAAKQPRLTFARVIVETTGLADPAPLINQLVAGVSPAFGLRDHVVARRFHLAGFVCAVDATTAPRTLEEHFECLKQIAFADRIVLTKTDLKDGTDQDEQSLKAQLRGVNPTADIVERHGNSFDIVRLFEPRGYITADRGEDVEGWLALERVLAAEQREHGTAGAKRHSGRITTFTLVHDAPIASNKLGDFLYFLKATAGTKLLRLKGIVAVSDSPDRPFVLHAVQHNVHPPRQLDTWPSGDRRTRLVLITDNLDRTVVRKLFDVITSSGNKRKRVAPKVAIVAVSALALITACVVLTTHGLARPSLAAPATPPPSSPILLGANNQRSESR